MAKTPASFFGRFHSGHFVNVFCGLFFHDVHHVVDGDETYKTVFIVNNRHRDEIVLLEKIRHVLLMVMGFDRFDVAFHQVADDLGILCGEQVAQCDRSFEVAEFIGHKEL